MINVLIIAEAGVNHNGSIELAKQMIDVAVTAGADAIKFQTFRADNLVAKSAPKANYQINDKNRCETQYQMLSRLELDLSAHQELMHYCDCRDVMFLSTPFDMDSIEMLDKLGMKIFKIPSGEINNLPYLRCVGSLGRDLILSTGMSNLGEIEDAINVLEAAGTPKSKMTVLHATTEYPCPPDEVNLNAMLTIRKVFNVNVGYSDHTDGIEVAIAAAALGATVIEKHFTLNRLLEGPDHSASLEPDQLSQMIRSIRSVSSALGDGVKKPTKSELKNIASVRKSIVARTDIEKGELITPQNITTKRPGCGVSPMRWDEIIGTISKKKYLKDDPL